MRDCLPCRELVHDTSRIRIPRQRLEMGSFIYSQQNRPVHNINVSAEIYGCAHDTVCLSLNGCMTNRAFLLSDNA